ncbi:MAG: GNAT family N-acetyltransferase [Bacteroidales bacterium]|nr:GNAT family N-acetyltransferase [Bacteroidales bacterium]MBN2763429.1 GNAT family N-acetyltransferase [Bacteroidales bacterium]
MYPSISLRALEPEDVEVLFRWENDPEIWKVSNTIAPFSRYTLEKYIENSHLDIYQVKQLRMMIDVKESARKKIRPVGTIDLFDFDAFHNRAGIGILIGDKSDRKKGYASEALAQFIRYTFDTLQLHQLYCNIATDNHESIGLFTRNGFIICGEKKDWLKTFNGYKNEYILQLINSSDALYR